MSALLEARQVSFAYGDQPILREVALAMDAGHVVMLLGPNGSGKSTLIKVLLGHLKAGGTVEWDGRNLRRWKRRELARTVAYLPQAPLWDADQRVADVLRLGRSPYWHAFGIESPRDMEVVEEVAALLELTPLLSRPMDQLSGGQRQRVFLGRCLVQEPRAMLLDEPNTFLDLRHQVEMCQLLQRLARDRSIGVLMASHDLNLAGAFADRILLLHEGRVAASGAPGDVLRPDLLEQIYGIPLERIERPGGVPVITPKLT